MLRLSVSIITLTATQYTVKRHFSVQVYLCELCESSAGRINLYRINFIAPYITMHETLQRINKNRVNFLRGPF